MGEFSLWHLILILGVILIFFGPSRLPGLGNSLGKAIRGFKSGMKGVGDDEDKAVESAREVLPPGTDDDKTPINTREKTKKDS
jgi:sec-independent protein translocase protein TatA